MPQPSWSRFQPWLACTGIALALLGWQTWVAPGLALALRPLFGGAAGGAALLVSALVFGSLGWAWLRRLRAAARGLDAELAQQRAELQAMARRLMDLQEDERRTLSRELHDDIGQQITAIKLGALALQRDDDAARREETIAEIIATADQTIAKLRNLSLLLRPPQLDALGLEAALRWQAGALIRNGRPRLTLELAALPQRPGTAVELACFRIAQEALTNILRHADAATVVLTLAHDAQGLRLTVRDDGHGFDPQAVHGLGLVTMRERAQQVGGRLEIESSGTGSCVRASLPLHGRSDAV